jgi:DHA1 family bicyclomycin/chloramphenicol resistance-like MFS transporter
MSSTPAPLHPAINQKLSISERELVVMLALLQALQALAIDAMLPALGDISRDLGLTDPNRRQLVVGLFLLGSGLGSLIPGLLADRFGRRPVMLGCLGGYIVLTIACALVTDFTVMVVIRVIQGMICAGLTVLPPTIVRDRFEGDRMARLQSLISVIFLCVPMLAPSIGQAILLFAGWRWIFGFMALLGAGMTAWAALRLPETLRPEFRQPIHPRTIATNMVTTLTTRESIGYVLGSACVLGALWGYIQCSQQLVAEHFGAGKAFPLFFGGMALAMAAANFMNSRIVEQFGARRVSHTAAIAYVFVSLLQVWLAHLPHQRLWQFVPVMTANMMLMGFLGANFSSIALQPFARIAGAASSVQSFVRLVVGSIIGAIVGQAYDESARPLAFALLAAGITSLLLVVFSERGKLFRRLYPVGTPRPS